MTAERPTPSTALATALVAALVREGVTEVVLCPGSRSSALAYAVEAAERAGSLRLHVRVDERSAGFLALGLAKLSRRPAVVMTTSGTAVANLHPAVLEAHHAQVPLLVLSADRPAELRGSGANQTTLQPGIFGVAPCFEADLAPETTALEAAKVVADAHARATGSGAAHLNVQFREPLVPDLSDDLAAALAHALTTDNSVGSPAPGPTAGARHQAEAQQPPSQQPSPLSPSQSQTQSPSPQQPRPAPPTLPARTLVVLGDLPTLEDATHVLEGAQARGWPVVAEPFGPHPRPQAIAHGSLVAGVEGFVAAHEPEAILLAGRPTLSRSITRLVRRPGPRLVLLDGGLELDVPGKDVTRITTADLDAQRGTEPTDSTPTDLAATRVFAAAWFAAGEALAAAINADPPAPTTGPGLARTIYAALPEGAVVFLGSSNAPRDLDLAVRPSSDLTVVASRGLAGIDGCVSTAIGLALSLPGRPTYAVLGDLTFLHDSNGLLLGPDEPRPDLTLVVVNDDGGGIFTTLEPGEPQRAATFERLFGTPTGTDLAALCRAHGIRHTAPSDHRELAATLAAHPDGLSVVEVRLGRATHRGERDRLRALAAKALGDLA